VEEVTKKKRKRKRKRGFLKDNEAAIILGPDGLPRLLIPKSDHNDIIEGHVLMMAKIAMCMKEEEFHNTVDKLWEKFEREIQEKLDAPTGQDQG
jgi:hypothetical protein